MKNFPLFYKCFSIVFITIGCCCLSSCATTLEYMRSIPLENGIERTFYQEMSALLPLLKSSLAEEDVKIVEENNINEKMQIIIGKTPLNGFGWLDDHDDIIIRVIIIKYSEEKTILRVVNEWRFNPPIIRLYKMRNFSTNLFSRIEQKLPK